MLEENGSVILITLCFDLLPPTLFNQSIVVIAFLLLILFICCRVSVVESVRPKTCYRNESNKKVLSCYVFIFSAHLITFTGWLLGLLSLVIRRRHLFIVSKVIEGRRKMLSRE